MHPECPAPNLTVEQLLRDVCPCRLTGLTGGDDPDVTPEGRFVDLAGMDKVKVIEIDHPLLLPCAVWFTTTRAVAAAAAVPISEQMLSKTAEDTLFLVHCSQLTKTL